MEGPTGVAVVAVVVALVAIVASHSQKQRTRVALLRRFEGEHVRLDVYRVTTRATGTLHKVAGVVSRVGTDAVLLTRLAVDPDTPHAEGWARNGIPLGDIVAVHLPDGRRIEWAKPRV